MYTVKDTYNQTVRQFDTYQEASCYKAYACRPDWTVKKE